jgi:hypothetical protein
MNLKVTQNVTVYLPIWWAYGLGGQVKVSNNYLSAAGPPPFASGGSLFLVQIVTPNRYYSAIDSHSNAGTYVSSLNGNTGLDTTCPYGWVAYSPYYQTNDSPGMPLTPDDLPLDDWACEPTVVAASLGDQFVDYIMYTPHPVSSELVQCVPLATFSWNDSGRVSSTEFPPVWPNSTIGNVNPTSSTLFPATYVFPNWSAVNDASSATWIGP